MEDSHIIYPNQRNYEKAYQVAFELVREKLSAITDIEERCRRSGAQYLDGSKWTVIMQYLGQPYAIGLPDGEVFPAAGTGQVSPRDKLLILHYFALARGTPLAGRLITFRELPEGGVYAPTFSQRTIKPLVDNFGKAPERLFKVSQRLGSRKAAYGDIAVTIDAFPRVPITIVLWRGDDEFPPQGNVLFDASISDYLATEDITVLCEVISWRLVRHLAEA